MTNRDNNHIPRLNLIAIRSSHPELSVQFYELLGLTFEKECHGKGPEHYSSQNGSYVFEIYPSGVTQQAENVVRIGFCIENLNELSNTLKQSGVVFLAPPKDSPWGRRMVVLDPDKNRVEIIEQHPSSM